VRTQWDPISFTVKVKIAHDEPLFETKTTVSNKSSSWVILTFTVNEMGSH